MTMPSWLRLRVAPHHAALAGCSPVHNLFLNANLDAFARTAAGIEARIALPGLAVDVGACQAGANLSAG